jgi:hypothetical protein
MLDAETKSTYLRNAMKPAEGSTTLETSDLEDNQVISVSIPDRSTSAQSVDPYFRPISNEKAYRLHELLLKSLISSNVPLTYLENPYFQEYQRELVRSPYKLPRRVQMIENVLPTVHAQHEVDLFERVKEQNQLTLSLDGWTDNAGNSIYALMALKGAKTKYFIDILDLHSKRHTAENIFSAIKTSLKSKQLEFDQLSAVVTDSPSTMIKLRVSSHTILFVFSF